MCLYSQLAEALFEYGRGNDEQALELLGPDFDANDYKVLEFDTYLGSTFMYECEC